ncbi:MAG: hypothetical protein D6784_00550, partial [Chloroflexi bacterium]
MLILFSITPLACLLAILLGLFITWYLYPTRYVNARISDLPQSEADQIVIMAAADFAEHHDIERARELLSALDVPNEAQYVSLVAERLVRTHRGPIDEDIKNVVSLADALGVASVALIAHVSTPTPTPTSTPLPTPTPTNTPVIPPTPTPAEPAPAAQAVDTPTPEPT